MTHPRRPDDARLSTADLAAASERATDRGREQQRAPQPPQPPGKQPADREVQQPNRPVAGARENQPPTAPTHPTAPADIERPSPLFAGNEAEEFRHRWADIQTGFVDEPRQAVERADALVAATMKRLAEVFAQERQNLEQQWARGGDVSTEDLRVALKRYRGFFDRLLSV
jgi:hypothetical protein